MAQSTLTLTVHRRWWVLPALGILTVLASCGLIDRKCRAAEWLARYGFKFSVGAA